MFELILSSEESLHLRNVHDGLVVHRGTICHCRFLSILALLLPVQLVVQFKKLTCHLVDGLGACPTHSEVAVVLDGLLDLIKAVTFDEVLLVIAIWTQSEQAHCTEQV